jgi:ribonuclease VapC
MVVDTSAVRAILLDEPEAATFINEIRASSSRLISVASRLELMIVVLKRSGPPGLQVLNRLLEALALVTVPVTPEHLNDLAYAYGTFGKGRRPAALNFGDCFVYALAHATREPLLCKGNDFRQTDLELHPASLGRIESNHD